MVPLRKAAALGAALGLLCGLPVSDPASGQDGRPAGPPPLQLAQIRLNPPGGGGRLADETRAVTAITIGEFLSMMTDEGVEDVKARPDVEPYYVDGRYKNVPIVASLGACTNKMCSETNLYALLGKQDTVDQKFLNAFNKNRYARLIVREDGKIELWLGTSFAEGVTPKYLKAQIGTFLATVDLASTFKVE